MTSPANATTVIWKCTLPQASRGFIKLPLGAEVLDVQNQNGWGVLWAICDPKAPLRQRLVVIVGTDDPVPPRDTYIGTFQANWFVGHVFLEPEDDE